MYAITNGLILHGGVTHFAQPSVFHDYMRPSVRLSAIMHQPITFTPTIRSLLVKMVRLINQSSN